MEDKIAKFMEENNCVGKSGLSKTFFVIEIGVGNNDIVIVADNEENELRSYECMTLIENYTEDDVETVRSLFNGDLEKHILIIE